MKYKTEDFKDRAELYAWAGEKKDILWLGEICKYGDDGYPLAFNYPLSSYKKVTYPKTKQYWLWDICDRKGFWHRNTFFMSEDGRSTGGITYDENWNELKKRKVEDSLLEIEE